MSLKDRLQAEQVGHLDLSAFCTVATGTTVRQAIERMRTEKSHVCLVTSDDNLIGVLTDRDVLKKIAASPTTWDSSIDEVMTADPAVVNLDSSAAEALILMTEKNIRNLPALDHNGRIAGAITHRAFIDYLAALYPIDILNLPPRPDHFPGQAEGG